VFPDCEFHFSDEIKLFEMKKLLVLSLLFAFVAVGFTSCKYEEGPGISLRSKTARLVGDWKLVAAYDIGVEVTDNYTQGGAEDYIFNIMEDNTFKLTTNGVELTGQWKFNEEKTEVIFSYDLDGNQEALFIKQLKHKEMILEQTSENPHTYHFSLIK
jgi:hypothetical protein